MTWRQIVPSWPVVPTAVRPVTEVAELVMNAAPGLGGSVVPFYGAALFSEEVTSPVWLTWKVRLPEFP